MQTLKVAKKKTPRSPLFGSILSPRHNNEEEKDEEFQENMVVEDASTHEFTNIRRSEQFPVITIVKNNSISPKKSKPQSKLVLQNLHMSEPKDSHKLKENRSFNEMLHPMPLNFPEDQNYYSKPEEILGSEGN